MKSQKKKIIDVGNTMIKIISVSFGFLIESRIKLEKPSVKKNVIFSKALSARLLF